MCGSELCPVAVCGMNGVEHPSHRVSIIEQCNCAKYFTSKAFMLIFLMLYKCSFRAKMTSVCIVCNTRVERD